MVLWIGEGWDGIGLEGSRAGIEVGKVWDGIGLEVELGLK